MGSERGRASEEEERLTEGRRTGGAAEGKEERGGLRTKRAGAARPRKSPRRGREGQEGRKTRGSGCDRQGGGARAAQRKRGGPQMEARLRRRTGRCQRERARGDGRRKGQRAEWMDGRWVTEDGRRRPSTSVVAVPRFCRPPSPAASRSLCAAPAAHRAAHCVQGLPGALEAGREAAAAAIVIAMLRQCWHGVFTLRFFFSFFSCSSPLLFSFLLSPSFFLPSSFSGRVCRPVGFLASRTRDGTLGRTLLPQFPPSSPSRFPSLSLSSPAPLALFFPLLLHNRPQRHGRGRQRDPRGRLWRARRRP